MSISITKSLGVKGVALWKLDANGAPGNNPVVDNVSITIPSIELESTTLQMMGSLDIPDVSRIANLQLTVNVPLDVPEVTEIFELGTSTKWLITWCSQIYNAVTSETTPKSFTVEVTGFIASIPNAEVNSGAENTGDVTMNLIAIKKTNTTDRIVEFEIDKSKGIFKVRGRDLLGQINSLY